jgi:hypothetical protein
MYTADLLSCILPTDFTLDHKDEGDYVTPDYNKGSYAENVKVYKMHNMINAQIYLQDAVESREPNSLLDQIVLSLMYHPRFPDTFFNFIANTVEGIPALQTENVEPFLEGSYGNTLQQPDCEYLSSILKLWSNRYTALRYTNLNKALAWIERKSQLLPEWPVNSSDSSTSKLAELKTNPQPTRRRAESVLLPKETEVLTKALKGLDLLDDTNRLIAGTGSGVVAGVINFLYSKKLILSNRAAAFRTLNTDFGLTTGKRNIQGLKRESAITKSYYNKLLAHFKDLEALR